MATPASNEAVDDLRLRIRRAIIRQEGMPGTWMNPGNLRDCPWFPAVVRLTGTAERTENGRQYFDGSPVLFKGGFWIPRTRAEGIAGLDHLIDLHIAQGNSLQDFIAGAPGVYAGFAPGADKNDPAKYVADVADWAGIPVTIEPLWLYLVE